MLIIENDYNQKCFLSSLMSTVRQSCSRVKYPYLGVHCSQAQSYIRAAPYINTVVKNIYFLWLASYARDISERLIVGDYVLKKKQVGILIHI